MPANQLSVSFSYIYSLELQAVKSAISVIHLYILQNLRPLASSFWKQCAFVCWSLLHLWVAQSGSQYMPCPCKKERGKVRAEVTCMHIDSGCCICCLYFLWPNYCLVSGRKGFFLCYYRRACTVWAFFAREFLQWVKKNKSCPSDRVVRWSK